MIFQVVQDCRHNFFILLRQTDGQTDRKALAIPRIALHAVAQ